MPFEIDEGERPRAAARPLDGGGGRGARAGPGGAPAAGRRRVRARRRRHRGARPHRRLAPARDSRRRLRAAGAGVAWLPGRPGPAGLHRPHPGRRADAARVRRRAAVRWSPAPCMASAARPCWRKESALDALGFVGVVTLGFGRGGGQPQAPAAAFRRAPRVRDGPDRRADRLADRLPDRGDRRLHRRAAAAAVRRRDLRRRPGHRVRAARARRAADRDHRRRPFGQRLRRRDRRDEAERRGRCPARHGHGPGRGAGAAAHPRARHRAAGAHGGRRRHGPRGRCAAVLVPRRHPVQPVRRARAGRDRAVRRSGSASSRRRCSRC